MIKLDEREAEGNLQNEFCVLCLCPSILVSIHIERLQSGGKYLNEA